MFLFNKNKESNIKPCPFCKGTAEINTGNFGEKYISCSNDNCGCRFGTGIWFTKEELAIEIWNKRR